MEEGKPVGYVSMRTKPGTDDIEAVSALYARMRESDLRGVFLKRGVLQRTGLALLASPTVDPPVSVPCGRRCEFGSSSEHGCCALPGESGPTPQPWGVPNCRLAPRGPDEGTRPGRTLFGWRIGL